MASFAGCARLSLRTPPKGAGTFGMSASRRRVAVQPGAPALTCAWMSWPASCLPSGPTQGLSGLRESMALSPTALGGDVVEAESAERGARDALGVEARLGVHDLGLVMVLEDVRQGEHADLQSAVQRAVVGQ